MDTVTYPTPAVDELLGDHFVCHVVNTKQPTPEARDLLRRFRLLWEPGLLFFDGRGNELRRIVGYRAPKRFLAELRLALAKRALLYRDFEGALTHLDQARAAAPDAETAPEALFWAGIVRFRIASGDKAVLEEAWREIETAYPESRWWEAADVLDATPTGVRRSGPDPDRRNRDSSAP